MRGWIHVATAGGFEVPVQVRNIAFILPPDSRRGGVTLAFGHERLETTHGLDAILDMIEAAQVMPEVRVHGVTAAVAPGPKAAAAMLEAEGAAGPAAEAPTPQTAVAAAMEKAAVKREHKGRRKS